MNQASRLSSSSAVTVLAMSTSLKSIVKSPDTSSSKTHVTEESEEVGAMQNYPLILIQVGLKSTLFHETYTLQLSPIGWDSASENLA